MRKLLLIILVFCLMGTGLNDLSLFAQNSDGNLKKARELFMTGEYTEARKLYEPFLKTLKGDSLISAMGYFETFIHTGEYEDGLKEVEKYLEDFPQNPNLLNAKSRILIKTGKYDEAETALKAALVQRYDHWQSVIDLGELMLLKGRRYDAQNLFNIVNGVSKRGDFRTADQILLAAISAIYLEDFHRANNLFRTASQLEPQNVFVLQRWAELFRDKFNNADAERTFEEALEINPNWADLYTGYARTVQSFAAKEEIARDALEKNPNHVEAMNILAELSILDSQYDEAEKLMERALEINPSSITSLANLASVYHFKEQQEEYTATEERALDINPYCSRFYDVLAVNCGLRFRYRDAVDFSFAAVARNRYDYKAYSNLGINLLRIGRVDEARRYLDYSFERDAFDIFAKNTLELIDEYENFDVIESEHFSLKIHNSESEVLGNSMIDLAEEAYDSLSIRYPYRPADKILLEAYNDEDDFAVRISGLPQLGLLGVCFGDIVAFDTPRAIKGREYNWARTLWHELAHVMALGISDHRVPRWFTEGLSVYEEYRARPEWERKMDIELYTAHHYDKLLSLDDINKGFTRPEFPGQIMLSYYQSSKIIKFITDNYGFEVIIGMLTEFGRKKNTHEAFKTVLGKSPKEINDAFFDYIDHEKDNFNDIIVTNGPNPFSNDRKERSVSLMQKLFGGKSSPFFKALTEGNEALSEQNYDEAEKKFREALEIYPYYTEPGNPYNGLARIYLAREESDKLIEIHERFLEVSEYGADPARKLGGFYADIGDIDKAEYYYSRSFHIEPYDIEARLKLAGYFMEAWLFEKEIHQRKIILALNPLDKSKAFYNLALSLYNNNNVPEAKTEVLKSLEIAPGFREAQKLLLKCIEKQR